MIDNETLNKIRTNVDIVDVISNYIKLTPKGKNFFGVCPFHDDHSPSMSVSKEKQIYTCFSCGATGNVFKFIQDYENISFVEAVKKCADMAGIFINIGSSKKISNKYQELYDIYELSQKFYVNNINTTYGKNARQYLLSRKLDDGIIKTFGIGLSLNEKDSLYKLLSKKYKDSLLIESGLVNENNYLFNDVYKNRIMFPLHDLSGRVIGYNGRVYNGEKENKYINSKETKIFKKRELLYNYHIAKEECRIKKSIIIMEGPMDIIRAYSIGVKNCVATLGTAFGKEQAMLIKRLSDNVILCFDGDDAGLKATKLAIEELGKFDIIPKIVRLEDNSDPDEYILKNGASKFIDKINNPINLIEFKEMLIKSDYNLSKTQDKASYVSKMLQEIGNIDDDILREISINKLSEEVNLDVEFLKNKLKPKKEKVEYIVKPKLQKFNKYIKSQQYLLYYMLKNVDVIKMYQNKVTYIPVEKYRHLAFQISLFYKENGYIDVADLITKLGDDVDSIKVIGEIESLDLPLEVNYDQIDDYINNIKDYNDKAMLTNYNKQLKEETDYKAKLELGRKAIELKKRREENDR